MATLGVQIFQQSSRWNFWPMKKVKNKTALIPSSWDDVTKKQLLVMAKYYRFEKMSSHDEFQLLSDWTKLPSVFFDRISELEVFELLKWMYDDISFSKSKMKSHGLWIGCGDYLKTMTMDQFGLLDGLFKAYIKTGEQKYLDDFSSVYFRPFFMPFSKRMVEIYRPLIKRFKIHVQIGCMINFVSLRKYMMEQHPNVFPKTTSKSSGDDSDWEHVTLQLAGGVFGDLNSTRNTKIPVVLKYCEMTAKQTKKQSKS